MKSKSTILLLGALALSGTSIWIGSQIPKASNIHNHNHHSSKQNEEVEESETWTCSMHPQIKLPKPGKCPLCAMDLILLDQTSTEQKDHQEAPNLTLSGYAQKLASVQTSTVIKSTSQKDIELQGEITWDENKNKTQTAWFQGRIEKLRVSYVGQYVKKGQIIAEVYSPEIYNTLKEWQLVQESESPELKKAIQNKLTLLGITPKHLKSLLNSSGKRISIKAQNSGVVTQLSVSEGDYIQTGQTIYSQNSTSKLWVNLKAFESDLSSIKLGQKLKIKVPNLPTQEVEAKVEFISPTLDKLTRTVTVRTSIKNPKNHFKVGMLAQASIASQAPSRLLIPESAPLLTGKMALVYIENKPGNYSARRVTLGNLNNGFYEVLQGLNEGEIIVSRGAFKIDAAMQIQSLPSMMYPEGVNDTPPLKVQVSEAILSLSPNDKKWISKYYTQYLELQNALHMDDTTSAFNSLKSLISTRKKTPKVFKNIQTSSSQLQINSLKNSHNIEELRSKWVLLSAQLIQWIKTTQFKPSQGASVYYCPMSNDSKGATWLQKGGDVKNPFYGQSMANCGEKLESISQGDQ